MRTWDGGAQQFTPQAGVPEGPYTLFGLRAALRAPRALGYAARGDDPSVLVEQV